MIEAAFAGLGGLFLLGIVLVAAWVAWVCVRDWVRRRRVVRASERKMYAELKELTR